MSDIVSPAPAPDSAAPLPIPLGSRVATTPIPSDIAGIDAEIASLTTAEPPTGQAAKARTDRLAMLWKARAGVAPTASDAPAEGYDAPTSGAAYGLEQSVPAGVGITDQAALGALKGSLAAAGVPAEAATGAFGHIAQLFADGAYASPQAFDAAVTASRDLLHKVHGYDGAKAIIADATAQADIMVRADPSLADHMEHAWASPVAIMTLANLKRFGGRK